MTPPPKLAEAGVFSGATEAAVGAGFFPEEKRSKNPMCGSAISTFQHGPTEILRTHNESALVVVHRYGRFKEPILGRDDATGETSRSRQALRPSYPILSQIAGYGCALRLARCLQNAASLREVRGENHTTLCNPIHATFRFPSSSSRSSLRAVRLWRAENAPADAVISHGKYLVERVGLCADCHSPRNQRGEFIREAWLGGAPLAFVPTVPMPAWGAVAPALAGRSDFTEDQFVHFLTTGEKPDGSRTRTPMPEFRFKEEDARAVARYLRSLPKPAVPETAAATVSNN